MSKRSKYEIYFKSGSEQKLWLTKLGKLQILYMPGGAGGVKILLQLVWNENISAAAASPQCLQWFFPHGPCCLGCGCSLFHLPSPFHQQLERTKRQRNQLLLHNSVSYLENRVSLSKALSNLNGSQMVLRPMLDPQFTQQD